MAFVITEATVLLFTVILLFAILLKKEKHKNQKILAALAALICGSLTLNILLGCSLAGWIEDYDPNALMLAEYVLKFATVIGTHYYILESTKKYVKIQKRLALFPLWNIAPLIAVPFVFDRGELLFQIKNCAVVRPNLFGELFLFIVLLNLLADLVISLVYLKKVGFKNSVMPICYEILPIVTAMADYRFGTEFVYTVIALLVLVDYIILGTEQDILIAQQRQHMAEQQEKLAVEQARITISQIQPHFLYNVISSIMACCKTDSEKAIAALADFSDYLRQNMRSIQCDSLVPFSKELQHIETYVRLEKLRFEDRLTMEYDIAEKDFLLPALSIQPLVENAVKHGIGQRFSGGKVLLRTRRTADGIAVSVIDDGVGFFIDRNGTGDGGDHIGLKNVRSRIEKMCGGTLEIESVLDKGTTVTVLLPERKEND